ncbi:hypothetical protein IGC83_004841 [Escherichia coli]|nr:hypothetical protein [Escherichia coli]EHK7165809.1 hypothetical protein [Escherichia coli]EIG4706959.1 hypothetical protein [Escherichia coli]EJB3788692.1 hypothetical protein [Escherichia coli]HDI9394508.1 hypothetical protein [Escherichia coli]
MKPAGILFLMVLCMVAIAIAFRQTWRLGQESARNEALHETIRSNSATLESIIAISRNTHALIAGLKVAEQHRNQEGEVRREHIRNAIRSDRCADTPVPAAISDSLQKRTVRLSPELVRSSTGEPHHSHNATTADGASDMGKNRSME